MSFVATSLRISSGVIVWAAHFAAIYGATALACARGAPALARWIVGAATLVAALAALVLIVREWRSRDEFIAWLTCATAGFALLAILWEGSSMLVVAPCD